MCKYKIGPLREEKNEKKNVYTRNTNPVWCCHARLQSTTTQPWSLCLFLFLLWPSALRGSDAGVSVLCRTGGELQAGSLLFLSSNVCKYDPHKSIQISPPPKKQTKKHW